MWHVQVIVVSFAGSVYLWCVVVCQTSRVKLGELVIGFLTPIIAAFLMFSCIMKVKKLPSCLSKFVASGDIEYTVSLYCI